jgi:hypothetical protein
MPHRRISAIQPEGGKVVEEVEVEAETVLERFQMRRLWSQTEVCGVYEILSPKRLVFRSSLNIFMRYMEIRLLGRIHLLFHALLIAVHIRIKTQLFPQYVSQRAAVS